MLKVSYGKKILLLSHLFLVLISRLYARDVSVLVTDLDLELPLEGAVVRSWDGSDHTCNEDGMVVITVPDDRQVTIQITYPGYETGRLVITTGASSFSMGLQLGGAIESRDLVIEAARPGASETRIGRSVAISGEVMEQSSQIGLIEDVMTSIKLLPGVGYTGMFSALPSIRGGDPGDLMASLDGFYISNPYHWGGGFSIFDPHMVESAQLSHGIFSSRYGHTISGLLEVNSKKPAPDYAEVELGVSTSAVNINIALPLGVPRGASILPGSDGNSAPRNNPGGILIMGKITYWDPFVWLLKQLSNVVDNENLQLINAVTTAPYIRSGAVIFNYRFNPELTVNATGFIGADGVGADYLNEYSSANVSYKSNMIFNFSNLQTFLITGITFAPRPTMVLKGTFGAGYEVAKIDGKFDYEYLRVRNPPLFSYDLGPEHLNMNFLITESVTNVQGRIDFDWSLGKGFVLAAGVQELFSQNSSNQEGRLIFEVRIEGPYSPEGWRGPPFPLISEGQTVYLNFPKEGELPGVNNKRLYSSAYTLLEFSSPANRFGAELGLRADHLYITGEEFSLQTMPVLNPRLNLDFNVMRNYGIVDSLDLTLGTGLFSSINDAIAYISLENNIKDFELKPNRSWTTVLGLKADFNGGWSYSLEGYYKYVFDRAYQYSLVLPGGSMPETIQRFNGDGIVWGFDTMLQKLESRYVDGWLSYTFTHARYHEPENRVRSLNMAEPDKVEDRPWYFPSFHRFHNLNLVFNIKPVKNFIIYTRFGLASGRPKSVVGDIEAYDVFVLDENENMVMVPTGIPGISRPLIIQKYKRSSWYSDDSRTTWSIPLDLKLSYTFYNSRTKVQTEMYIAAENLLSLVYVAQANTRFNQYTGTEDTGSDSANYEMPVPMVSIGLKWSY